MNFFSESRARTPEIIFMQFSASFQERDVSSLVRLKLNRSRADPAGLLPARTTARVGAVVRARETT
jgi:hypothetical protein